MLDWHSGSGLCMLTPHFVSHRFPVAWTGICLHVNFTLTW